MLIQVELTRAQRKKIRDDLVSKIIVTTASGKVFDGDEKSQERMNRVKTNGSPGETTGWIMADNEPAIVTYEELGEAAKLAGLEQSRIWMEYA